VALRGARERPARLFGRGATLVLALCLAAPGGSLPSASAAGTRSTRVPTIYHKSRSFRIPFNVDPADRPRLKEVQLWVSRDSGFGWERTSTTTPDNPAFTFRAARDGEYWFAVRTLDSKGQIYPSADETVEPSMKVVVDTTPPTLMLESDGRRGSLAAVRWEVRDEHLDLKSLVVEYQAEGVRDWRSVPIRRPALIGSENWDAGTADPLKVRASVADKAGNVAEMVINLPDGTPRQPGAQTDDAAMFSTPPPVAQVSSGPDERRGARPSSSDPFGPPSPDPAPAPAAAPPSAASGAEPDLFSGLTGTDPVPTPAVESTPVPTPVPAPTPAPEGAASGRPLLVSSPRFPLQYAVEDAGPSGPARVELWVTSDGGRSWFCKGEDTDKVSPFPVDLGSEGTFGLRLVARSASGSGDPPPAPGDRPDSVVEVDSTPPVVQLLPIKVGTGANLGRVAIQWKTTETHLGPKPVVLSWRPEQSGVQWQPIAGPMENSGKFLWTVPTTLPPRFHVRVDVVDTAGNRGYADTADTAPVVLDRTRPRGRIIGLDPSARAGPASGPFR